MARNPQIVVEYVAKTAALKSGIDDAAKQTDGFASKLKGLAKGGALAAGAAGIGGLVATLKLGFDEFSQGQKVAAQTNAVLKSTGRAAGVSAKQVDDLATSLMNKSGTDDEAIKSGENLMLTFTNVRNEAGKGNDVFNQATATMLDMSTALGTDMKGSAIQLGKALNDPIAGVGALAEVGVTFTEQQKKQIKALVDSGKTMDAQKIILGELNREFGGSAEAAGKTLPGQLNILKERFSNLAGELVGRLIPVLQDAVAWLRDHWPEISAAFDSFWASAKPVLENLWQLLKQVAGVIQDAWPVLGPIIEGLGKQVQAMATIIATALKLVTDLIRGDWKAAWEDVKKIVGAAIDLVVARITTSVTVIRVIATALGKAILGGVQAGVGALAGWVGDRIDDVKAALAGAVISVYFAAKNLGGKILGGIVDGMTGLYSDVRDRISGAVNAIGDFLERAAAKGGQIGSAIKDGMLSSLGGLASAVGSIAKSAVNAIIDVWNHFHIPAVKVKGHTVIPGFDLPNIPHLAAGGIATSPTLALIGEAGPEAVVPLSSAGASALEVRVFIGETELRGMVRTEIVDHDTGIARTLLAGAA